MSAIPTISSAANSVWSVSVAGTITGTVSIPGSPVAIYNHDTGDKLGDAVVSGANWTYTRTCTTADYGIVSIDARSGATIGSPVAVHVVSWPHVLWGAACSDFYYGWVGVTLGVGDQVASIASYGVDGATLTAEGAPVVSTVAGVFGGRQCIDYGASDNHVNLLRSAALDKDAPFTLIWHGLRTAAPAATKIVMDGEDTSPRALFYSDTVDGTYWTVSNGTAVQTTVAVNGEKTLIFRAGDGDGASRLDYIESGTWNVGGAINTGANAQHEGCTAGNRYAAPYTGMGHKALFWGFLTSDPSADEKTQFLRWEEVVLAGYPFL